MTQRYINGMTDWVAVYGTPRDEDTTHHRADDDAARRLITTDEALIRVAPRCPAT